jgi:hypothetical protein
MRTDDMGVRAFDNVCRHRGVRFAQGRGSKPGRFVCPFHGWCYGTDGQNARVTQAGSFTSHNLEPSSELNLTSPRPSTSRTCRSNSWACTRTFEYMRLSEQNEGHISNYQRVLDGYLAGYPTEKLLAALRKVNLNPLEQPVADIER